MKLKLSLLEGERPERAKRPRSAFPYFGGIASEHFPNNQQTDVLVRTVPVQRISLGKAGEKREALVATVFDLQVANYGVARGLAGELAAKDFDDDTPYTPAWQERITGTPRAQLITVARQFADNAHKTHGKSMVIIGAAMNHWYHSDMNYRGVINMLMMCGCIGQSGGGWAHYVGQEKLRPQTGWTALAFALDWIRPPRQMNSTSFFYAHTDQWRYEKLGMEEVLSPLADKKRLRRQHDRLQRARRAHGLAAVARRNCRPIRCRWCATRRRPAWTQGLRGQGAQGRLAEDELRRPGPSGQLAAQHVRVALQHAGLDRARATSISSSTCSGTSNGVQGKDLGAEEAKPAEVVWHDEAPEGKLDLLVTLDFRMSTTCLYSRHRAADRHLVREERPQHQRHAPVHPPAVDRGGPGLAVAQRLGDLQGLRQEIQRSLRRPPGRRARTGADAADARQSRRAGAAVRGEGLEARRVRADSRQDRAEHRGGRARLPQRLQALHRLGSADGQDRQRRQGHRLEHADGGEAARRTQRPRHRRRRDPRHAEDRDRHRRRARWC